jgi:hypothetical protein
MSSRVPEIGCANSVVTCDAAGVSGIAAATSSAVNNLFIGRPSFSGIERKDRRNDMAGP